MQSKVVQLKLLIQKQFGEDEFVFSSPNHFTFSTEGSESSLCADFCAEAPKAFRRVLALRRGSDRPATTPAECYKIPQSAHTDLHSCPLGLKFQ